MVAHSKTESWLTLAGQVAHCGTDYSHPQDRYGCKTPSEVRQEALSSDVPTEYPIPENKRISKYKEKWCA